MKLRAALGVVAVAVTISACGGSLVPTGVSSGGGGGSASAASSPASGSSASSGGNSAVAAAATGGDFCTRLKAAEDQLDNFNDSVGDGDLTAASKVIANDVKVFQQLAQGAPAEVKPALVDIAQVLSGAVGTLGNPASPNVAAMQALATKLPTDLQAMETYVESHCAD